jgi:flagellar assembly protein FliH
MLSKLLRRSALVTVSPAPWRPASSPSAPGRSTPEKRALEKKVADVGEVEGSVLRLKARIVELESILEKCANESRETGHREGVAFGRSQAAAEVKPVIEKLAQSIQNISELRPKLRLQAEADIVKLALAIARRVVNRELNTDPEAVVGLVKVALGKLRIQEVTRVRVHPNHLGIIKEMLSHWGGSGALEIEGDAGVGLGGILFDTARGEFDASIDVQLNEIERGLTDRLAS